MLTATDERGTAPKREFKLAMYARASISWFGDKAIEKTAQRAEALAGRGDNEG